MKYKNLKIFILVFTLSIILNLYNYFVYRNIAYAVVTEYDIKRSEILKTKLFENEYTYIDNDEQVRYAQMRDMYNIKWASQLDVNVGKIQIASSCIKCIPFFNYFVLELKMDTNLIDDKVPLKNENIQYNRIILLKKTKNNWRIVKDIFNYNENSRFTSLFDLNYVSNKIESYKKLIN